MKYVISDLRKAEVDILDISGEMVHVRAKHGAPFTIRGSRPPYFTLLTDDTYVRICDILDETMPSQDEDAAVEDSLRAFDADDELLQRDRETYDLRAGG
jgi:hypothetical protein